MLFTHQEDHMNDAVSIGKAPAGSILLRKATIEDLRIDPARVALFQSPDGRYVWLGIPKDDKRD